VLEPPVLEPPTESPPLPFPPLPPLPPDAPPVAPDAQIPLAQLLSVGSASFVPHAHTKAATIAYATTDGIFARSVLIPDKRQ